MPQAMILFKMHFLSLLLKIGEPNLPSVLGRPYGGSWGLNSSKSLSSPFYTTRLFNPHMHLMWVGSNFAVCCFLLLSGQGYWCCFFPLLPPPPLSFFNRGDGYIPSLCQAIRLLWKTGLRLFTKHLHRPIWKERLHIWLCLWLGWQANCKCCLQKKPLFCFSKKIALCILGCTCCSLLLSH